MIKILSERPWLFALTLVFIVAFPGFLRVEYINNKTNSVVECINNWADLTVNRSIKVTAANFERNDALDKVLRSAAAGNREDLIKDLQDYVTESDIYKNVLKENPIPKSPELICK